MTCRSLKLSLVVLGALLSAALPALAAVSRVALVHISPELSALATCVAARVAETGPVVRAQALVEGLEFRLTVRSEAGGPALLVVQGLLKPDITGLIESHAHDDDPEAQPAAARRFFNLLRIPVGTRAWVWQAQRQESLCGEVANWVTQLRSRPILFDRLGPDGEPR